MPYGLSNCIGWYVAGRGVYGDAGVTAATNGDGVAQWNDLSGAGNHLTQATAANRPVLCTYAAATMAGGPATVSPWGDAIMLDQPSYGRSVLFDGTTSFLNLPTSLGLTTAGFTVVMCTRGVGFAPVSLGTSGTSTLNYGWVGGTPQRMGVFTPAAGVVPFPAVTYLPVLQPIIHGIRCSAALGETRLYLGTNQQSVLSTNYGNVALTGGAVGRTLNVSSGSYGNFGFAGEVSELLICSGPVDDATMASLLADMQTANQLPGDANGSQLVFVGDDLTAGGPGVAAAVGRCYPWHLCQRYGGTVKPLLVATPGYTVVQQQALVTQQVVPLDRVPFACNVAVVCAGTNDLAAGTAAASVSAGVATLCSSLRSAGFAVAVATITPRSAATAALQITLSAAIDAVNSDIRSGYTAYADALVDWANDPRLADYTDVTWFAADGCHTTDAGDAVKAELVKTAVDPLLVAPTAPLSFASFYPVNRTFAGRYGNFPRA